MHYATILEVSAWAGFSLLGIGGQMVLNTVTPPISRVPGLLTIGIGALLLAALHATL